MTGQTDAAAAPMGAPARGAGRPRRYSPDAEVELLLDAAMTVMARNDYQDVTVADVLAEAGLSTRSFYRHYASKDDLVCALYRRDADRAAAHLAGKVDRTTGPLDALEVWIDEILGLTYDVKRARRVAVLRSVGARRAEGSLEEATRANERLASSLVAILERGRSEGTFPLAVPEPDAQAILAVALDAAGLTSERPRQDRAIVRAQVLSFSLRALGGVLAAS